MPALTQEEYEALNGPLERQNGKAQKLGRLLEAWEDSCPAATWLKSLCGKHTFPAYYFGGVCRDIWNGKQPRDIDIVIDDYAWKYFLKEVEIFRPKLNSFGGLKIVIEGTEVDVWPVGETWSFTQGLSAPRCVTKLPETTLLNIEAVVAIVWFPDGKLVFEEGFFKAMESRTLEVQNLSLYQEIPHPPLALARIQRFLDQGWKKGRTIEQFQARFPLPQEPIEAASVAHYG